MCAMVAVVPLLLQVLHELAWRDRLQLVVGQRAQGILTVLEGAGLGVRRCHRYWTKTKRKT